MIIIFYAGFQAINKNSFVAWESKDSEHSSRLLLTELVADLHLYLHFIFLDKAFRFCYLTMKGIVLVIPHYCDTRDAVHWSGS